MSGEKWEWGNPETVAMRKQGMTCKSCKHEVLYTAFEQPVWICTNKDKNDKRRQHGRRCEAYQYKGK